MPISAWTGKTTIAFWLFCLVLMVAVAFSGENVNGATRWLDLGAFQLQPSEFMKIAVALMVSRTFGYVVTAALTAMIVFQAFLNMACVMGAFPLTGKPLPLVSYGGSSMLSTMLLLGIVLSSWRESHISEKEYRRRREDLRVLRVECEPRPRAKGTERPQAYGDAVRHHRPRR